MTPEAASPIVDEPGSHGMFMIGTDTLYLSHMPMFTMEKHMYQMVLRATLPDEVMQQYVAGRKDAPTNVFNLANSDDDLFTLPDIGSGRRTSFKADVWADYSNADAGPVGDPIVSGVTVQIEQIVHLRHFDSDIPRPAHLTYMLFGSGPEAHLTHYIARDPDYQHIVTLGSAPSWLDPVQIESGVQLNLADVPSEPIPCSQPLTESSCSVMFQGLADPQFTLDLAGATTVWFSTGNLLNATDPCDPTAPARE